MIELLRLSWPFERRGNTCQTCEIRFALRVVYDLCPILSLCRGWNVRGEVWRWLIAPVYIYIYIYRFGIPKGMMIAVGDVETGGFPNSVVTWISGLKRSIELELFDRYIPLSGNFLILWDTFCIEIVYFMRRYIQFIPLYLIFHFCNFIFAASWLYFHPLSLGKKRQFSIHNHLWLHNATSFPTFSYKIVVVLMTISIVYFIKYILQLNNTLDFYSCPYCYYIFKNK